MYMETVRPSINLYSCLQHNTLILLITRSFQTYHNNLNPFKELVISVEHKLGCKLPQNGLFVFEVVLQLFPMFFVAGLESFGYF